jgi:hypothetical protein
MRRDKEPIAEVKCPTCNGTGFPKVNNPSKLAAKSIQRRVSVGRNCPDKWHAVRAPRALNILFPQAVRSFYC